MAFPDYGAAPLVKTFFLARGVAIASMIAIIGMTADFIAQIVSTNRTVPQEIIGTLIMTCIAAFYSLISLPFFYSNANLGLLVMAVMDGLLLIGFIIVSVLLGKPVSYLDCMVIGDSNAAGSAQSAVQFAQSLASTFNNSDGTLMLSNWASATRMNCLETKAVWGLAIALSICFSCSSLILPSLWFKAKKTSGKLAV